MVDEGLGTKETRTTKMWYANLKHLNQRLRLGTFHCHFGQFSVVLLENILKNKWYKRLLYFGQKDIF